jgi:hypothetical protein
MSWLAALPGGGDTLAVIACLALTAATLLYVFATHPDAVDSAPHRTHLDQVLEQRDAIYENLRDLKFEYRAGKFAEQDYEQMKDALENEAAVVLAEIENLTGSQARPVRPTRRDPGTGPSEAAAGPRA